MVDIDGDKNMSSHACYTGRQVGVWYICVYFDVFEFKHVSLYKSASNLLIGPSDEQLVIVIGLR